jgi:catechol 2,3-dioxygenase-like lactoylglutathione lyase family enzyme
MSFASMAPAFFSTDMERTHKFWTALGFEARRSDDDFMILEHPAGFGLMFGLDPELDPAKNKTNAYLRFTTKDEVVALHDEWAVHVPTTRSHEGFIGAPEERPWGTFEWPMLDPDSNLLRVGTRLG